MFICNHILHMYCITPPQWWRPFSASVGDNITIDTSILQSGRKNLTPKKPPPKQKKRPGPGTAEKFDTQPEAVFHVVVCSLPFEARQEKLGYLLQEGRPQLSKSPFQNIIFIYFTNLSKNKQQEWLFWSLDIHDMLDFVDAFWAT